MSGTLVFEWISGKKLLETLQAETRRDRVAVAIDPALTAGLPTVLAYVPISTLRGLVRSRLDQDDDDSYAICKQHGVIYVISRDSNE